MSNFTITEFEFVGRAFRINYTYERPCPMSGYPDTIKDSLSMDLNGAERMMTYLIAHLPRHIDALREQLKTEAVARKAELERELKSLDAILKDKP